MKQIALCIDDYALREGVDSAVLQLAGRGLATATSCLVGSPRWPAAATALRACKGIDTGLHLDFTETPFDESLRSGLGAFIARAYLRRLPEDRLRAEIRAQFDAFEQAMGHAPDHVDGHQHVHQLPQVRLIVIEELQRRGHRATWLRGTATADRDFKASVIHALGGAALRRSVRARRLRLSGRLLGVYGFDEDESGYRTLLGDWLREARDGDVLMCHPGDSDDGSVPDPIAAARAVEARVLREELPHLLAQYGCELVRLGGRPDLPGTREG